jgi:hypothetical protein
MVGVEACQEAKMHLAFAVLQQIILVITSLILLAGGFHLWWHPFRRRRQSLFRSFVRVVDWRTRRISSRGQSEG